MRIAIREQLALLVLLTVLVALAVVSVPTWLYVNNHIANNLRDGLSLTASLKASRISSELELIQTSCLTISSRLLIQDALSNFYENGGSRDAWNRAALDISSALSIGADNGLLQARIYSRNQTGESLTGLLNITAGNVPEITLPYGGIDGGPAILNDTDDGYPPQLYPNITYVDLGRENMYRPNASAIAAEAFPGVRISRDGGLLLGPMILNESMALISISIPIRDNRDMFILGYMTVVALATSLVEVRDSPEGLDDSGIVLIVGPSNPWNRFNESLAASNATYKPNREAIGEAPMHFILPTSTIHPHAADRHSKHNFSMGTGDAPFPLKDYPAALDANAEQIDTVNNASSMLNTHNEQHVPVAVGFARTQTSLVNWTIIVEKSQHEAKQPIDTLREILLGTVFGTAGFIALLIWPCAHLSVMPIRKLKSATERSINPPGYDDSFIESDYEGESPGSGRISNRSSRSNNNHKKGIMTTISRMMKSRYRKGSSDRDATRRFFKIPGKVEDRKHFIEDELTELTGTFNDMSDELVKQYSSLEEKVDLRTRELNESKKAAEAANESKTLFIANISHELKTPLNGIMGMCSVCMEETDINKIKASLGTLFQSGDLLLHLLDDLLSFSKNQIGQELAMEMREFRLAEVRSQILTIFDKQVREGNINFAVSFVGSTEMMDDVASKVQGHPGTSLPAYGPQGTGRLKDMCLYGDYHRILQVIINLVSNSLKFTPHGGTVEVRIKCLGEHHETNDDSSRASSFSKHSKSGRARYRVGSTGAQSTSSSAVGSNLNNPQGGTAIAINPMDPKGVAPILFRESSPAPPPPNAKPYVFEFEVEDTGPGIPLNMQEKVFEPFVQGDLGLSRKYGGTGLGLSICHQLAGLMGGSIKLSSTEGVGTKFTMRIPLKYTKDRPSSTLSSASNIAIKDSTGDEIAKAAEALKPAEALNSQPRLVGLRQPYFTGNSPTPTNPDFNANISGLERTIAKRDSQGKLRVLVADDNSTNIEVVSRMLKLEDVSDVTIAKDGQEAYDLVKQTMENNQSFDVIFMDVQMPNVDGLQSTRLIRGIGYTSPIVALTAFSEESNVKDCIASGMNEFLAKPIRRPALKQVLKRFATIPEESETGSVFTKKTSSLEPSPEDKKHEPVLPEEPSSAPINEKTQPNANGHATNGAAT